jgi:excisionase family DNA binding protein
MTEINKSTPAVLEHPGVWPRPIEEVTTMSAYATPIPESVAPRGSGFLTRDEVMTAREVAELLRMPTSTVYELARKGVLPASRLGRTWRFLRPRLEELLAA